MAENDPNDWRKDYAQDLGQRIRDDVHKSILDRTGRRSLRRDRTGFGGALVGGIVIAIGVLLLLQNLGLTWADQAWDYWPVILIAAGISRVVGASHVGARVWGGAIALVGVLLLLRNFGLIHGNLWSYFWPVMFICVGLGMLARGAERQGYWRRNGAVFNSSAPPSINSLSEWAIFGGGGRQVTTQDFEGGEALAIFGGLRIDLRQAATKKEHIVIDANALFGGIDIKVPENWNVIVRGAGIFGGYEDKTDEHPIDEKRPHLTITGYAMFGGVTVKN